MYDAHNIPFLKTVNSIKIEVLTAGFAELDHNWNSHDVCSPYSRLYYVYSGKGNITLHTRSTNSSTFGELRPGQLYLIPNGLPYNYSCDEYLKKIYFHINVLLPDGQELFHGCNNYYELPLEESALTDLQNWFLSDCPDSFFHLQGAIYHAIGCFIKHIGLEDKINTRYSLPIQQLFELLPYADISTPVSALAKQLHCSESTLRKQFKSETRMTIGAYREQQIMIRARQLLALNQLSVGEIANTLGFHDQLYFSKYFKQRQGMTPSEYKKYYV